MNLASIRSLFATTQKVGDRPKQKGKQGAFEQELAEEAKEEDAKKPNQEKRQERDTPLSKASGESSGLGRLTKKPTMKPSSDTKGLKIDLFA